MGGDPMLGYVDTPADPHALLPADVVEKSLERRDSPRAAAEPRVQAYRQHLGAVLPLRITFAVQGIERVLQVVEELRARIESLQGGEAHVVGVERVGYYPVRH